VNGYAYVAEARWGDYQQFGGGLRAVDISNPAAPRPVSFYDTPGWALGVSVAANYAYVADGNGLVVIDVSDPATPHQVGDYNLMNGATSITVAGRYAFVTSERDGLFIFWYTGGLPATYLPLIVKTH